MALTTAQRIEDQQRVDIPGDIGNDLGELLFADAEYERTQAHLAAVLRFYGWTCTPPAPAPRRRKGRG